MITSDQASSAIHARIPGSFRSGSTGIWYIPCTTSYPLIDNIFVTIGGVKFGIPIEDIAWKVSDTYEGQCVSGVQVSRSRSTIRSVNEKGRAACLTSLSWEICSSRITMSCFRTGRRMSGNYRLVSAIAAMSLRSSNSH
jgi:hypothetical protein